jgi:predicted Zn-dependent peptidase
MPELKDRAAYVRHDAYRNGGVFRIGASVRSAAEAAKALESGRATLRDIAATGPTTAELENAKRAFAASTGAGSLSLDALAVSWLDEHSYNSKAATAPEMAHAAGSFTTSETQRVGARLFLHTPSATVAVGDAAQLKTELARVGVVEVFGESAAKPEATNATPKPQQPTFQLKRP